MSVKYFLVAMCALGSMLLRAGVASGQTYPNRPIRIITAEPGGSVGIAARVVATGISSPLGQDVIIDNRGAALAGDLVAKAPPDGYTLLVTGSTLWVVPLLQKMNYDAVRDFAPISLLASTPNILVVNPSLPVKSVTELIALAKSRPGGLNYSSGVAGSPSQLAGELFKSMAGVNIVNVPYKASAPAMLDVIRGEVQLMFLTAAAATAPIQGGKLRALGVTSATPSPLAPGLSTISSLGLPGYEIVSETAILAPAKTPDAVVHRLNQEIVQFLTQASVKKQFLDLQTEAVSCSPEELVAKMKTEIAQMGKVIKDAGIHLE